MDFRLFGRWHATILPGTWVLLAIVLVALTAGAVLAKKLIENLQ